jgi:arylsulfatase A-like enzyme
VVTDQSIQWIQAVSKQPLFLHLALAAPHVPLAPAKEFQGKSGAGAFGDFVAQLDWCVGEILQCLKECGVEENTLVLFASDNGAVMFADML